MIPSRQSGFVTWLKSFVAVSSHFMTCEALFNITPSRRTGFETWEKSIIINPSRESGFET